MRRQGDSRAVARGETTLKGGSVANRLHDVRAMNRRGYTPSEDAVLQRMTSTDRSALAEPLGRTPSSIRHRISRLGATVKPRWTEADDERLRFFWDTPTTIPELCAKFGRSAQGICRRARRLGLQQRVPPGYEFLSHAAERAGFAARTLRRILHWAGVAVHNVRSHGMKRRPLPVRRKASFRQLYVDPFDVDEAVERWLRTETPGEAARRTGVDATTIRRLLRKAGGDGEPGFRRRWRVDSELLDRLLRERHRPSH